METLLVCKNGTIKSYECNLTLYEPAKCLESRKNVRFIAYKKAAQNIWMAF